MLQDAKADPDTTVIVVWRYDRFSRGNTASAIQSELLRHGVRIESAEEGYYDPDSETGAIMMPLTWSLNRLFSIKLRNVVIPNMKTNFETRDQATGWAYKNGGWAQFGYKKHRIKVGRSHKSTDIYKVIWLLDDREVNGKPIWQWVRTMLIDWRLKERLGYDSIAARLTVAGVPTPSGKPVWSTSSIQAVIGEWDRLYQYAGIAFWNREDCTDRGNRRRRDTSEWTVVENAHPAIVSQDEAEAIWAMVEDKKRQKSGKKGSASRYALSGGLIKCKYCGANYAGVNKPAGDYYVCGSHIYRRGADCGASWYIPREEIERLIFSKLLKKIPSEPAELQRCVDEVNEAICRERSVYTNTASERKSKVAALEAQMWNLSEAIASAGALPELMENLNATNAALGRLRRLDDVELPKPVTIHEMQNLREEMEAAASSTGSPLRQAMLKQFVVEIVADAQTKTLEGTLIDPRALFSGPECSQTDSSSQIGSSMAAPRGVEPLLQP